MTSIAENVDFTSDYLEFDFSPTSFKFIKSINEDLLKTIHSDFAPMNDRKQSALQLIIDENFPNALFASLISYDNKLSLRELMS